MNLVGAFCWVLPILLFRFFSLYEMEIVRSCYLPRDVEHVEISLATTGVDFFQYT